MAEDPNEARQRFARRLRAAMKSRSQTWLAETVGVDQTTVSSWLRGEAFPRLDRLPAIEEALGLPQGELMAALYGIDRQPATATVQQAIQADAKLPENLKGVLVALVEAIVAELGR